MQTSSPHGFLTLTTGALAAVYDRQDDWLALSTLTLQAEEADWVVWVETVAAALALWAEVGLLDGEMKERWWKIRNTEAQPQKESDEMGGTNQKIGKLGPKNFGMK